MAEPSNVALKELILLDLHPDASWPDHGFDSPIFKPVIEQRFDEYYTKYGES